MLSTIIAACCLAQIPYFMSKYRCASFFAGVGGIDLGFKESGHFKTVYANEFDRMAVRTFECNFPIKVDCRDIRSIDSSEVPPHDIALAGFPCQAFSIAGYRKGFEDEKGRGTLFFDFLRVIKRVSPSVVFLENVKNLVAHDSGKTFRIICEALESNGYHVKYQVLNAKDFGNVPQNRERIYIVGFQKLEEFRNFEFPMPTKLTRKLDDVIDYTDVQDPAFYYTEENCSFYRLLEEAMTDSSTVYQWRRVYVRQNKSNVCPTLTANMGTGGHNVPLIRDINGIRKLTPRECFNLQGFPSNFVLPTDIARTYLYKQAGNSVVVSVIRRIALNIYKALSQH